MVWRSVGRRAHASNAQRTSRLCGWLLGLLVAATVEAQQPAPSASALSPEALAKSVHNPFEDFVKIPVESDTGFGAAPNHNVGDSVSVTPVVPFRLNEAWDLIARPNVTVTYQPSFGERFGVDDSQLSLYLTPHGAGKWIWGLGPLFQLPTATSDSLGTGRWSAGPTAALIYSDGPWFNGILTNQLMSFAGDRDRGSVNQTYLEPEVSYNFESGWYIDTDPPITFDWTAKEANGWTLPAGFDAGKAFDLGSQSMSLQVGPYDLLKRPAGAPQWVMRVQLQLLFPAAK